MAPSSTAPTSQIQAKLNAVTQAPQPKITGAIVTEDQNSVVLKAGDAVIEIPVQHVLGRVQTGGDHEFTLAPDAQILVSAAVSAKAGFIGNNVFGALVPYFLADNCNCNCNCGGSSSIGKVTASTDIAKPFTGGAREQ